MFKIYIVPTPIGNRKDITLRALELLENVDCVLAEDTRKSNRLLKHYQITTNILSHHQYNEHLQVQKIIKDLIVRLMESAKEEAEHKGWCDTELSTRDAAC